MATKESKEAALDEAYERLNVVIDNVKKEYDAISHRMAESFSAEQLKPFADILLKHEFEFDSDVTIESLKGVLIAEHISNWNDMWTGSIADGMKRLEMLKNHFKEFEGTNWNIEKKTAEQRLLPVRVHYKQNRVLWLQKQVEHQNKLLKGKYKDAEDRRLFIKSVLDEDLRLTEIIASRNFSAEMEETKKELIKLLYYPDQGL